ncbi:hypothetical protein BC940DRAFT_243008 [Gongronella butleri]|nr:hypothetical protein BC940DRAFT_243008 [Gongronella butleri]
MPLISKQAVSPDTVLLRVRTQAIENQAYPVPSCVYIKDDAIQVMRPYTPLNPNPYKDGYIDLLVKRYPNGSVSRTLAGFPVNEHIHIRGPIIEPYQYEQNSLDQIGMIAGGTGISPMYQLIRHILENDNDKRAKLWLLYANKTEDDILLKPELDALAAQHGDRFKVVYVLETPPVDWHGATGRVTPTLISSMLKNKDQEALRVFVCGPDAMLHAVCGQKPRFDTQGPINGMLGALGLSSSQVWKFQ